MVLVRKSVQLRFHLLSPVMGSLLRLRVRFEVVTQLLEVACRRNVGWRKIAQQIPLTMPVQMPPVHVVEQELLTAITMAHSIPEMKLRQHMRLEDVVLLA